MAASLTQARESEFARLQIHRWLGAAVLNWLLIVSAFVLLAVLPWPERLLLLPLALVIIGTRQHALALLAHDGAHYLCSRNRSLNDVLTTVLCAYPLFASLRSYRKFHLAHHQHIGTRGDPEFEFKLGMAPRFDLPVQRRQVYVQFAKDCLGFGLPDILHTLKTLKPIDLRDATYLAVFWTIVAGTLALTGYIWCLVVWFVALNTVQWAVFRIRIWTEHSGLATGTHRIQPNWWQRLLFFPTNTWCHYEHHEAASTPFHRLPALRQTMKEEPLISLNELFERLSLEPARPSGVRIRD